MRDTREQILLTALQLFAHQGYEGVSVSDIAVQLGVTKSALYKHYKNKRDLFDQIVARMEQLDAERARDYEVPEGTRAQMADCYAHTQLAQIARYSAAQFDYWTQEEFPCAFRRLLTLEQYRSAEMAGLYQQYLGAGPLNYVRDLFAEILPKQADADRQALAFYAPIYLLIALYDGADEAERPQITRQAHAHVARFIEGLEVWA